MKQMIKNFLFKKRIKILKSKKGFSLLEVMIAVAIIGIIAGIAVPRFQDYRETATLTSTDTTASNLAKAYNLCLATDATGTCLLLDDLKIDCPICKTNTFSKDNSDQSVCIALEKKSGPKTFNGCVEIATDGKVKKTYGGDFKICVGKKTGTPTVIDPLPTIKKCDKKSECSLPPTGWVANSEDCLGGQNTGVCTTGNCT